MKPIDGTQEEIWDLETLQRMDWRGFELLCSEIFRALDYDVEETCTGPDGGIDLICKIDALKFVVQCKREADPIKAKIVRQLGGCMLRDHEENGAFITTGTFSDLAKEEFENHQNLELVDGDDVLEGISEFPTSTQGNWYERFASGPDWDVPTCVYCDEKMVPKRGKPDFWGCVNYRRNHGRSLIKAAISPILPHHW